MNYRTMSLFRKFFLSICLAVYALAFARYQIPEKPKVLYPVFDEAQMLTKQEQKKLNDKLIAYADSTSTEIEVVIIPSTKGEDVNFLATMIGEKWGIGQKGVDNGVVFLIAKDDHTMSIQQGRSVEQYLTASTAGEILDYMVTPYFRKGKFYQGIDNGTNAIMEALQGKYKPIKKQDDSNSEGDIAQYILIFIIVVVILIILSNQNNDGGTTISSRGRRMYPGGIFFPGGFGGGSRGGGFGGFGGGGSFGGGGASGGW